MIGRGVKTAGVGMIASPVLSCVLDDQRSRKQVMSLMGY
jgi:GTP cyclohydrolase IA